MADIQLNEYVKISGLGSEALAIANARAISKVVLWDLGPSKPVMPKRPDAPEGAPGTPKYDLAQIEFKEVLEGYDAALKAFRQAKIDHADFLKRYGGPYELEMWSCDAHDAIARGVERDADGEIVRHRYVISSKTRGHERLKNGGLPTGMKPGHGQSEIERRVAEGDAEFEAARRADPIFGTQEVRS